MCCCCRDSITPFGRQVSPSTLLRAGEEVVLRVSVVCLLEHREHAIPPASTGVLSQCQFLDCHFDLREQVRVFLVSRGSLHEPENRVESGDATPRAFSHAVDGGGSAGKVKLALE